MHLALPSRRAVGLLTAGVLGLAAAGFCSAGAAQAAPVAFSGTVTAAGTNGPITVPAGYCEIRWTVIGGQGGGDGSTDGAFGGELDLTTYVSAGDVFLLQPGQVGAAAGASAPGGLSGNQSSGAAGDSSTGAGGGASVVRSGSTTSAPIYLQAYGGDGAGVSGSVGTGGGGGANQTPDAVVDSPDLDGESSQAGDGSIGYDGVPCQVPDAPDLAYVAPDDGAALLFFSPPADDDAVAPVTGYEYTLDGTTWTTLSTDEVDAYDWVGEIDGLTNGTRYQVAMRATSDNGPSDPSDTGTVVPGYVIAAPTNVTARAGISSITVSWRAPANEPDITGYEVEADPQSGNGSTPVTGRCRTGAAARSCVIGVTPGTSYAVFVTAVPPAGEYADTSDPVFTGGIHGPAAPAAPPAASAPLSTGTGSDAPLTTGQQLTLTGSGYLPFSRVTLIIYSTPTVLGTVTTDASGAFRATVRVPSSLPAGAHSLVASGVDPSGTPRYLRSDVTVTSPAGTGDSLAWTGFDATGPVLAGGLAILAGAGLLLLSRRRAR